MQALRPTSKFGLRHWPSTLPVVFMPTSTTSTSSREARRLKKKLSFLLTVRAHVLSQFMQIILIKIISTSMVGTSVSIDSEQAGVDATRRPVSMRERSRCTSSRMALSSNSPRVSVRKSTYTKVSPVCLSVFTVDAAVTWKALWQSGLSICIRIAHPRGASGFFGGLKLWMRSPYHHQRVAVNRHVDSQVVDPFVMDLVQKTGMCAVLRRQGLEVQSILMDHILCRRRFAVPAGVEVISIPIWNSFAFQSVVQEIPPFPPFPPRPSHDSPG